MMHWLQDHRRKKILQQAFPAHWQTILEKMVHHYLFLDTGEKEHLQQLVQIFLAEKRFEGCNGLEISDEIRVVIAAQACILLLGLPHDLYPGLISLLIYPATVVVPPPKVSVFSQSPLVEPSEKAIYGQAVMRGPVILVWDEVKRGALHPESGHNVVYHEFAHLLDMETGAANGTPRLHGRDQYRHWATVCAEEFFLLRKKAERGEKTFLDSYGALNEAEFFAVATEYFFDRPLRMEQEHQPLYNVLKEFYRQDTAQRQRRYSHGAR